MEDTQNSSPTPSILYCECNICSKPITHFCKDHNQAFCHDCAIDLHERCKLNEIADSKSVIENLDASKLLLTSFREISEHLNPSLRINFDEEFKIYSEMLAMISEKIEKCIGDNKLHELCLIMKEIHQFQKKFKESNLFTEFSKLNDSKFACEKDLERSSNEIKLPNDDKSVLSSIMKDRLNIIDP